MIWTFANPHDIGVICYKNCPFCGGNPVDWVFSEPLEAIPLKIIREATQEECIEEYGQYLRGYCYEVETD